MLYIYAKVVMRRPNAKAYGHLVDALSYRFKMADIYIYVSRSEFSGSSVYRLVCGNIATIRLVKVFGN